MESAREKLTLTLDQWTREGFRLFGTHNRDYWEFICPGCGIITQVKVCKMLKIPMHEIGKSCIGLYEPAYQSKMNIWGYGPCKFIGTEDSLPVEVINGDLSIFCFHFADYKIYPKIDGPGSIHHNGIYYKHYAGECR